MSSEAPIDEDYNEEEHDRVGELEAYVSDLEDQVQRLLEYMVKKGIIDTDAYEELKE